MGDKSQARALMQAGCPRAPGGGDDQSDAALLEAADGIGVPLLGSSRRRWREGYVDRT